MKLLMKKEWKLVVTPVPLLFLLLSALVLVPSYPYYVTFFYNALGIFLMLQAARENRDVYYMALLPVTKRDVVRARFSTVVTLQLLQIAACIPFMLLRRSYAQIEQSRRHRGESGLSRLRVRADGAVQPDVSADALQKRL